MLFGNFGYFISLEIDVALLLNKFKPPFTQKCFVPSLLEIITPVLEKMSISLLSPLGHARSHMRSHSFKESGIPFIQKCFVPILVKPCPVILEKRMKILKFTDRQKDRLTDGWTMGANLSSQLRWLNTFISIS